MYPVLILKKYGHFIKLFFLPFLAWLEIEDYAALLGFLIYMLAILLFVQGALRVFQFNKLYAAVGLVIALSLTFSFWNDFFKSEIIATASKGGDMQDFHGELVLRKNGCCEIYNLSFMSSGRCNSNYKIVNDIVLIEDCNEWVNEFDSIKIGNTSYLISKTQ